MEELKILFTSNARVLILKIFLDQYATGNTDPLYPRELERRLVPHGIYIANVRAALQSLTDCGILKSEEKGFKKIYTLVDNKNRIHALINLFNTYVE